MKRLLLVMGMVGCGQKEAESTAAFEELFRFDQLNYKNGEVGDILSADPQVTDAGLVNLKGLTKLKMLNLGNTHRVRRIRWISDNQAAGRFGQIDSTTANQTNDGFVIRFRISAV